MRQKMNKSEHPGVTDVEKFYGTAMIHQIIAAAVRLSRTNPARARAIIAIICRAGASPAEEHYTKRKRVMDRFQKTIDRHLAYAKHETLRNVERHFRSPAPQEKGKWRRHLLAQITSASEPDQPTEEQRRVAAQLTFHKKTFSDELMSALHDESSAALATAGQELYDELGRDDPWTMPARETVDFLRRRENLLADVPDEIHQQIENALIDGLKAGDTHDELISRIEKAFEGVGEGRASTIASTETAAAYGYSRDKAMQSAGVTHKKWLISHSPFIKQHRPTHVAADGQVRKVTEPYHVGGEALMYPGDEKGSPENTINCHCISIPIAEEDVPPRGQSGSDRHATETEESP
jgi:uncharacterized protein with gpF-like domain